MSGSTGERVAVVTASARSLPPPVVAAVFDEVAFWCDETTATPDAEVYSAVLPGFEARGWYGIVVPKATPTEIVEKLNKEINAALADPNMKTRLTDLGAAVFAGSPADFGKFIADEIEKWGKVIKFAGIKAE